MILGTLQGVHPCPWILVLASDWSKHLAHGSMGPLVSKQETTKTTLKGSMHMTSGDIDQETVVGPGPKGGVGRPSPWSCHVSRPPQPTYEPT